MSQNGDQNKREEGGERERERERGRNNFFQNEVILHIGFKK